ncbi:MAG: peptidyl-prolyl cis-trans isomerase [Polyangiaceae bacterium]|nr:peptidyl-prolyl cis-trans isomerase [Polyangiaceae bacterium]
MRLGLERDDPAVRRRVAVKLLAVYRAGLALPAPTEPELRAHHEAHRDRWDKPALVDFTQVFVSGKGADAEARARELLARLSSGAEPSSLGDTYSGGRRYRLRPVAELREAFGADFADGLEQAPLGRWHERRSPAGLHLVRIEKRTPGERPSFEEVRGDVAADLGVERSERAIRARVQDLIRRAEVRERP